MAAHSGSSLTSIRFGCGFFPVNSILPVRTPAVAGSTLNQTGFAGGAFSVVVCFAPEHPNSAPRAITGIRVRAPKALLNILIWSFRGDHSGARRADPLPAV